MTTEERLKNVIFSVIDRNSTDSANLEEVREIDEAIKIAKSEWCRKQRYDVLKQLINKQEE